MTPEEFEQWLINMGESMESFASMLSNEGVEHDAKIAHQAMSATFKEVLAKYKSIFPASTTLN